MKKKEKEEKKILRSNDKKAIEECANIPCKNHQRGRDSTRSDL